MAQFKALTRAVGDYSRGFAIEDGKNYRVESQDLSGVMRHVERVRHSEQAGNISKAAEREYIGSVPSVVLMDWLRSRGYTLDQFARNEGGTRCPAGSSPKAHAMLDGGVRSEFLRYFLLHV